MELKNLIREGVVSTVYAERATARIVFADRDNLVSAELPVLQGVGLKNKSYLLPDVGESVVALMVPNSEDGTGFIIGSRYHDKNQPPAQSQDVSMLKFSDGTSISYNRKTHELKIDCVGNIIVKGQRIDLN